MESTECGIVGGIGGNEEAMSHDWLDQEERMKGEGEYDSPELKRNLEEAVARQRRHEACSDGKHEEGATFWIQVRGGEMQMLKCKWCRSVYI